MDILLYNPLSRNGKDPEFIQKIVKHLENEGKIVRPKDILKLGNVDDFMKELDPDDRIILVGGDGTLNRLVNVIHKKKFTQDLYMYQAGTGNDFIRSLHTTDRIVSIKPFIERIPTIQFNKQKRLFLNGAGIGMDGYIARLVNSARGNKNRLNYFKNTLKGFLLFKPMKIKFSVDGTTYEDDKVWLASVMNGPYFGGGMKIAPNANRLDDELDLVLVKKIPKLLLFLIFPTIYNGKHVRFKKWVNIYRGKHFELSFEKDTYMQIDGDDEYPIKDIVVDAYEDKKK